jgi:hypothetical protein
MSKSGDERPDRASSRGNVGAVVRGAGKASVQLADDWEASAILKVTALSMMIYVEIDASSDFGPIFLLPGLAAREG